MRAAQIQNNVVVNFVEVASLTDTFIDPTGAVIGSTWDGIKFIAPSLPIPTEADYVHAISVYLDQGAKNKNYDSIITAALRAGFTGPYQADGIAYANWMDACWKQAYDTLAKVQAGTIAQPTVTDFINSLPKSPF